MPSGLRRAKLRARQVTFDFADSGSSSAFPSRATRADVGCGPMHLLKHLARRLQAATAMVQLMRMGRARHRRGRQSPLLQQTGRPSATTRPSSTASTSSRCVITFASIRRILVRRPGKRIPGPNLKRRFNEPGRPCSACKFVRIWIEVLIGARWGVVRKSSELSVPQSRAHYV